MFEYGCIFFSGVYLHTQPEGASAASHMCWVCLSSNRMEFRRNGRTVTRDFMPWHLHDKRIWNVIQVTYIILFFSSNNNNNIALYLRICFKDFIQKITEILPIICNSFQSSLRKGFHTLALNKQHRGINHAANLYDGFIVILIRLERYPQRTCLCL